MTERDNRCSSVSIVVFQNREKTKTFYIYIVEFKQTEMNLIACVCVLLFCSIYSILAISKNHFNSDDQACAWLQSICLFSFR